MIYTCVLFMLDKFTCSYLRISAQSDSKQTNKKMSQQTILLLSLTHTVEPGGWMQGPLSPKQVAATVLRRIQQQLDWQRYGTFRHRKLM